LGDTNVDEKGHEAKTNAIRRASPSEVQKKESLTIHDRTSGTRRGERDGGTWGKEEKGGEEVRKNARGAVVAGHPRGRGRIVIWGGGGQPTFKSVKLLSQRGGPLGQRREETEKGK